MSVRLCTLAVALAIGCGGGDPPPPDHAPTVDDATATTPEDTAVAVTLTAVDPDGDAVTIAVAPPGHGTVTVSGRTVTYTPAQDFAGTESLAVTATAGGLSDTAVLAITVTPVNDPPIAMDDLRAAVEDEVHVVPVATLLANDTDVDGDPLVITEVASPTDGTVALVGDNVEFTPTANFAGDATFVYTLSDGTATDTATVTLQIGSANDPPVAVDDARTTAEDTPLVIAGTTLTANDTDAEGGALTVTAVGSPINGTVALAAGAVTFTPTADFTGTASFEYTVSDGAATDAGLVTVTVTAVNDPPVAVDDARTTGEDAPLVIAGTALTANDTDVDGDALTVTAVGSPVNGTVALAAGTVTFTPAANFSGSASFEYTVGDGTATDTGVVTVTVTAANDPPVAVDDARATAEDTALAITGASLTANDTDIDGGALTVTAVGSPVNGTVALAAGTVTFTPAANFSGTASFVYTVSDGAATDTGLVTVTVTAVNDPPVAVDDARTTAEDAPLAVTGASLTANDTDVDGGALTVTAVSSPINGTVALAAGTVTFTPSPNFSGTAGFAYTVSDGTATDIGLVTVTVTAVNDPPIAVDDARTTAEDTALAVTGASLAANDTDIDGGALTVTAVGNATNGAVTLAAGTVTFTPAANFNGTGSFEYTVSDGTATDTGLVTVTITAVNDPPVAVNDARTTAEDTPLVLTSASLTANDTDIDGGALTVSAVGSAINGTVALAGGTVTFTPSPNFSGTASFPYTVSDGAATDTGLVIVTVTAVNDPPVAVDDARTTAEDTALAITGASLTANDTDIDGGALTVTAVGSPVNGTVALAAGTVTFTPAANFNGTASFSYTVSDGAATDTGLVTITVTAVNDPPVAVDDARTTAEDTALAITGASLVANDTDIDGGALTVTAVSGPVNGTVALAAGTVTFTPAANFSGTASFVYTVSDGAATDTGLVTVTVTAVNDPPVAIDDARTTAEDTALAITGASLTANDTDIDGGALTVTSVGNATNGTVVLAAGTVTFTPAANFNGTASFEYTVSDGAATDTGLVTVTVTAVNDPPVAVDDARTTAEDTPLAITGASLVANDTDIDGGALTVTSVGNATNGTVVLAAGTVTFTPAANFNGTASFEYTVSDGAATDTGLVTVTVTAVNDPPVAVDDARTTAEDTPLAITGASLVANDTDIDGGALTVTAVSGPVNGTVALAAGTVTFTPAANFNGTASFVYTVSDGAATDTGLVTVTVTAVNDAPVAVDDARTTAEDTALAITGASLVANDTDADGDALTVTAVSSPVNGTVALAAGTVTFTPTANFSGTASFVYTVSDGAATDTGLVTITVTAVNDPPVAVDDARTTAEDTALAITGASLVANDTDIDGGALTVTAVSGPVNGTVALAAGTVTFTPAANFNGTASFVYTVSDGAATDTGLVTVTVTAVNDPPVAVDDSRATAANTPLAITGASLVANDTDVDGGALTVTAVGNAVNGTVALAAGTVTFTPNAGFSGTATFEYTVSDGAATDIGLVTVTVSAPGAIAQLVGGNSHMCALANDGAVKCWGLNAYGNLGLGDTNRRGDEPNEMGANLPEVDLGTGRTAVWLATGGEHTCALLDNGWVKCWGYGGAGQLGLGSAGSRGNGAGQMGDNLPPVDFGTGRTAVQLDGGAEHTCAVLDDGTVKCWGNNDNGQLGLGDTANRGDNAGEMGDALPAVNLGTGRTAVQVAAGGGHTCALLDNNTVKCWGRNDRGQLGQGHTANIGDGAGEMGDALPAISLGTGLVVEELVMGELHSCALFTNHTVKCWGFGSFGALGIGDIGDRGTGPGEMGDALPAVNLGTGRTALAIAAGHHTCALLDNFTVKCWGFGDFGQLGQGSTAWIGDGPGEMGDALPAVNLGTGVTPNLITTMLYDSCVLTTNDLVKCWGGNLNGQLGQGDTIYRGDGPGEMGDSLPYISLW